MHKFVKKSRVVMFIKTTDATKFWILHFAIITEGASSWTIAKIFSDRIFTFKSTRDTHILRQNLRQYQKTILCQSH
jgi:hypothetical protein